ncbi:MULTISPECIES: lysine--tRNA ligase [unclassified Methylophaga]|jgi:lysyl-tRNA synthetase class 2|uniref:lysine--tRNA ligase n=2 Tax=Methylophaga TaxID=40222 RepID=UPI000C467FFC|nr:MULTISPECIES: lysine--tRNA ligase [unclassified Methylophaga]MAL49950.1 lysine--tRNA ligase [Methylophaga sp.]MAM28677.1 lysine--tRNA ligase [Flavobacteriaceae bacterium]MBP24826.1 lysine--tRNA ligase [Methylophaga sp.]HCC80932.1 lysine--tRNA ligase [Methylophaga sp.]|tara:strand:+ start:2627 stop:4120 length:1494 start_codon:yes stop_codon:yes gene_type:complete
MTQETEFDENRLIAQRREKLATIREQGNAFPNDFRRNVMNGELQTEYAEWDGDQLKATPRRVAIAGRMMTKRVMGKASFATVRDMSGDIQLYVARDELPEGVYPQFKTWDNGDIIAAEGTLFRTQKGELSIHVETIKLLTKSLRPLPEKFHGLSDMETRYRQRYVDLIMNEASRETFRIRTKVIDGVRRYLMDKDYLEVETPMMQAIPGGATARPFTTYHNALDMDLFLRIAPELYLKRLIVGGFERVFEINRNFRNEGLSTRHNPEFTMVEFYQAYADFNDLMDLTEDMLRTVTQNVLGSSKVHYQGLDIDFAKPFDRMTVKDSILHFNPDLKAEQLDSIEAAREVAQGLGIPLKDSYGLGKVQIEIFEKTVEHQLMQPTFITAYPTEVSPLARRSDNDSFVTDRFEFFVGGREIANGFSELNDAEDQAERFKAQVAEKDAGDIEAMHYDADYIRALEYGMPPTAGEGIGIDRLVMLLTDSPSIRDVLLFPHMRPE